MKELFLLIDGNSLINRAFYALPPLNAQDGTPTNAVYGFCTMLIRAITDYRPTHIAVAFDRKEPTFRHKEYKEYKATRKGMPQELAVQMPILKNLLNIMSIQTIEKAGYEADDIIGTLADCTRQTVIVTGDKDSFQLIDDCTTVAYTKRGISDVASYTVEEFEKEYGFVPIKMVDYKALLGDTSDNIPGVAGIGAKTASKLIIDYGSLQGVYDNIEQLKGSIKDKLLQGKESAYLSRSLAKIDRKVPLDITDNDCKFDMPFGDLVKKEFTRLNFGSLARKNELFEKGEQLLDGTENKQSTKQDEKIKCPSIIEISDLNQMQLDDSFCIIIDKDIYIATARNQYKINLVYDLLGGLDGGFDLGSVLGYLKVYLQDPSIKKVVFDAKAMMKQLKPWGIELKNYFDTKLAYYLIDVNIKLDNLDEFCLHFGYGKNDAAYAVINESAGFDKKMKELDIKSLYYDIELPLCRVLFDMENVGFKLDMHLNESIGKDLVQRAAAIESEIHNDCGVEFNINSPKQLGNVLFEILNIPYPKKGKDYSTAIEILEPLKVDYPVIEKVLNYRKITKLNNTYIEGFKKLADKNGVVHTDFKQALTLTGRLSSTEPNLQNIPIREEEGKALRALFVAEEGSTLISADYSQIELRLLAHFSGDPVICAAFNAGEDIHAQTASQVYDVAVDSVTPQMRYSAKAVNFGIIYGISDFGLAASLKVSVKRAREMIDLYFLRFKKVKEYLDECIRFAKQNGYTKTILNRIRRIPQLKYSNYQMRKFGERVAMNMPLQGSAADIIKVAMIKADKELQGTGAKLILQVHDELIVSSPDSQVDNVKKILKSTMENAISLNVPLVADVGSGKRWIDCK